MSTAAQTKANRQNAKHSTGPVTEQGKSASSLNHLDHGFCGSFRILKHEDAQAYDTLLLNLREEHRPTTATDSILLERLARHHWLSLRAQFLQSSLFFERHLTADEQKYLDLYLRYQSTNDRAFFRCLKELASLRAEKHNQRIGFEREKRIAAEEIRNQESHDVRTRIANARATDLEIEVSIKERAESGVPTVTNESIPSPKSLLARSLRVKAEKKTSKQSLVKTSNAA